MKIYFIILLGILSALTAQTMNTISALFLKKYYLYVLIFTIICQFLIGYFLMLYYGNGIKYIKYSILGLIYFGSSIIISILIQIFIFHQNFKISDIISMFFIIIGIIIYLFYKN
jgi:multidrug transporter EmrE-like cation transporter